MLDNDNKNDELGYLKREIVELKNTIAGLTNRVAALETGGLVNKIQQVEDLAKSEKQKSIPDDKKWTHVGQEVLLPRVAAVCFVMVVALILRTVTDNGMIDIQVGSYLGTFYALCLIGWGWFLYGKGHRIAPVIPSSGIILLYSIIYETHVHFESLSSTMVYSILLLAEVVVVFIGLRCRAVALLYFATFGSTFVGVAVGFPEPLFALLGVVLVVNNFAGHLGAARGITPSLRWYTLFFSGVFWLLWTYKLNYALRFAENADAIGLYWSMPVLLLFFAMYSYSSLWQTKTKPDAIGFFHYLLPVITVNGLFMVVYFICIPWLGQTEMIGLGAVVLASLYIALVSWLAKGKGLEHKGGKEFIVPATLLLIQGLAITVPPLWAALLWSLAALLLTLQSHKWQSGAARFISYLFQLFVLVFVVKSDVYRIPDSGLSYGLLAAVLLGAISLWLYRWCRKNPPNYETVFFSFVDPRDYSAAMFLIIGLAHSFCMLRFGSSFLLQATLENPANAFYCSQSIIINLGAVLMMIGGVKSSNRELLALSVLVVLAGALKVFIFDLFRAEGMPLVLSVFSFGVVAVVSSITMKKWQSIRMAKEVAVE